MNTFDITKYNTDCLLWLNQREKEFRDEAEEREHKIAAAEELCEFQEKKIEETRNKLQEMQQELEELEGKQKESLKERDQLKQEKEEKENIFAQEKENKLDEMIKTLMEVPKIVRRCSEIIFYKTKLLTCSVCGEESTRENMLVKICEESHLQCTKCSSNEGKCLKCNRERSVDYSEESETRLKEIELLKTIRERLESTSLIS